MSLKERLKLIFSKVLEFLAPFIRVFMVSYGEVVLTVAYNAVKEIAESFKEADGETKRKMAIQKIKEELKARGIEVTASVINGAIEAAYQKLKAEMQKK